LTETFTLFGGLSGIVGVLGALASAGCSKSFSASDIDFAFELPRLNLNIRGKPAKKVKNFMDVTS